MCDSFFGGGLFFLLFAANDLQERCTVDPIVIGMVEAGLKSIHLIVSNVVSTVHLHPSRENSSTNVAHSVCVEMVKDHVSVDVLGAGFLGEGGLCSNQGDKQVLESLQPASLEAIPLDLGDVIVRAMAAIV